ncbi:MAG: IclR family transcriptional regulator [Actinobacteria bacterium]|nr:MAG: IclR family transcriptional regulator [Actinomycetota bacterium]
MTTLAVARAAHPVKSADRVLDILELLAAEPEGLTLSEIGRRLAIARSSAHGLVHTLLQRGYLRQENAGSRNFRLGVRLIQLGLNVGDRLELRSTARPVLERLVSTTHDTALIVVPEAGELLFLDKVVSETRDVRTDPRSSAPRPLHCTSIGKALLAALDDESAAMIVESAGLPPATEFSMTDLQALLDDLQETRRRGYAIDRQEAVLGVCCVGAPVRDFTGRPVGSISLSTVREFFDPETTGPWVAEAAVEISRAMGWDGDLGALYEPVPGSAEVLLSE